MVRADAPLVQSAELLVKPLRVVVPLRVAPEMLGPVPSTMFTVPVCVGKSASASERKSGVPGMPDTGPAKTLLAL